jgi:hypothetical protein
MPPVTRLIPSQLGHPLALGGAVENLPLVGEKEIRLHGSMKIFQSLDGMPEAAAGIHGPDTAGFFMVSEDFCHRGRATPVRKVAD